LDKIRRLRQARPDLALSSDFIIGFPSETAEDFELTMALIEAARVDSAYSFIYSARPGTPAANLRDNVSLEVKQQRLERLQTRIRELGDEYAHQLIGTTQKVLVEKTARRPGQLSGKTPCNRPLNFDGPESLIGQFVDVQI
ncbi:TRAM domain-containing protein, partial [Idiomarina zobellii]|uniref:TRAM domain-containing protein n=1 Tax=Idiomarina zobellii TaxID=86103 RepID=UPI00128DA732